MKRFIWYSDTHMNLSVLPFMKRLYVMRLKRESADGLFITGDISSGGWLESDLRFLARNFPGPIYFVLGNHDYHGRHVESVHADIRRICSEYSNLNWMTEKGVVSLNEDVALIGAEGWYDGEAGDPDLLFWTLDRFLTFDFLHLSSMDERVALWRTMALQAAQSVASKLEEALAHHKTVYVLTHFPPWEEATKTAGTTRDLWLSYNTNVAMGAAIEEVMRGRKKKRVVVLAGHTHAPCRIRVTNSIECHVARASYLGKISPEQTIII